MVQIGQDLARVIVKLSGSVAYWYWTTDTPAHRVSAVAAAVLVSLLIPTGVDPSHPR